MIIWCGRKRLIRMKKMLGVKVEDESQGYMITFEEETQEFSPDEPYGMKKMNGSKFSTAQVRNDIHTSNCGEKYGPWWHKNCHDECMNGPYSRKESTEYAKGIIWNSWKGLYMSLKESTIMIRPRLFDP